MIKYFLFQSIGRVYYIYFFINNNSGIRLLILLIIFIKWGIIPFHNYIINILNSIESTSIFFLVLIQKIPSAIFTNFICYEILHLIEYITIFIVLVIPGIILYALKWIKDFQDLFIISSIIQSLLIILTSRKFLWIRIIFILFYTIILIMIIIRNIISKKKNFFLFFNILNLSGTPPFIMFYYKRLILINFSIYLNNLFISVILIEILVFSLLYYLIVEKLL